MTTQANIRIQEAAADRRKESYSNAPVAELVPVETGEEYSLDNIQFESNYPDGHKVIFDPHTTASEQKCAKQWQFIFYPGLILPQAAVDKFDYSTNWDPETGEGHLTFTVSPEQHIGYLPIQRLRQKLNVIDGGYQGSGSYYRGKKSPFIIKRKGQPDVHLKDIYYDSDRGENSEAFSSGRQNSHLLGSSLGYAAILAREVDPEDTTAGRFLVVWEGNKPESDAEVIFGYTHDVRPVRYWGQPELEQHVRSGSSLYKFLCEHGVLPWVGELGEGGNFSAIPNFYLTLFNRIHWINDFTLMQECGDQKELSPAEQIERACGILSALSGSQPSFIENVSNGESSLEDLLNSFEELMRKHKENSEQFALEWLEKHGKDLKNVQILDEIENLLNLTHSEELILYLETRREIHPEMQLLSRSYRLMEHSTEVNPDSFDEVMKLAHKMSSRFEQNLSHEEFKAYVTEEKDGGYLNWKYVFPEELRAAPPRDLYNYLVNKIRSVYLTRMLREVIYLSELLQDAAALHQFEQQNPKQFEDLYHSIYPFDEIEFEESKQLATRYQNQRDSLQEEYNNLKSRTGRFNRHKKRLEQLERLIQGANIKANITAWGIFSDASDARSDAFNQYILKYLPRDKSTTVIIPGFQDELRKEKDSEE